MSQRKSRNESRTDSLRIPPHSISSEQAVLGGIMLAPECIDLVTEILVEEDFYRKDHRLIFRAITVLNEKSQPFDAVTVGEWFESQSMLEIVGGGAYLVELASTTPSAANVRAYAEIVRDKSLFRQLIEGSTDTLNDAFFPDGQELQEVITSAEERLFRVSEASTGRRHTAVMLPAALSQAFSVLQDRYESKGQCTGISTGYPEFDRLTSGLQDTDLLILAARPSQGKTTLALNIAEYAALKEKKVVAVFSMEMSASQLSFRMISSQGRVNASRLRDGSLEDEDWPRITDAIRRLKDAKIIIDDTPSLTPDELRSKARRLKREHGVGLIVIDYLQLMHVPGNKENRATEVSEISRNLKALAKELNVPVIALSQLNRGLETRADKRPVMADLRESGSIEQDADVIIFIYRDEYYNKDSPDKGLAEIIIGKQRNGPTGMIKLKFFGEYTCFTSLSRESDGGTFE